MKNKLTVNKLAQSNLRARKKQYTFMIIGIVLAMVFSSGVLFFASCLNSSMDEMMKSAFGIQDAIMLNADEDVIKEAKEENLITDYGFAHIVGFAYTDEKGKNNGTSVAYLDDKAKELSYISFIEGGYPETGNEIALEKAALSRLGIDAKIGDTLTLSVLTQNGSELMSDPVEKSYKLVGIAKNKRSNLMNSYGYNNNAIPAAFVKQGTQTEIGGKESLFCYFNCNSGLNNFYEQFNSFLQANQLSEESWALSGYQNAGYGYSLGDMGEKIGFAIVFIIILLIASCMGIVNAFSSNLDDRKKQIGMFRTVGATKRQIISIFGREAFLISIICAPISVCISYFAVKGVTSLMGDSFVFIPNWWVLILCALFSVACVMLAALIPLGRAARISPIQSIRNIELTRKMKTKRIKTKKSFNASALMAKRNLSFNKTNQIIVTFLLIVTIVFSCYGFSFMDAAKNDYYTIGYDYRLSTDTHYVYDGPASEYINVKTGKSGYGYTEDDRQKAISIPYVDSVNAYEDCRALIQTDSFSDYLNTMAYYNFWVYSTDVFKFFDEITPENIDSLMTAEYSETYLEVKKLGQISGNYFPSGINAYDNSVIERLEDSVIDGRIDMNKLNSGEEIILAAPQNIAFTMEPDGSGGISYSLDSDNDIQAGKNYLKKASCDYRAGDTIDISVLTCDETDEYGNLPDSCEVNSKTVTIGAIISTLPDNFSYEGSTYFKNNIIMITSLNGMNTFAPDTQYSRLNISLTGDCDQEIDKEMQEQLQEISDSVYGSEMASNFENLQDQRSYMNSLFFSMLSIIVLFLSISASIINNSLTARIRESKREIGTLRAVGASQSDISGSYIRQLFSIFGFSYLIGFAVFFISFAAVAINHRVKETPMDMNLTVWQTILACVILFAVCALNLWSKIRKEMKNSIIDNIREL